MNPPPVKDSGTRERILEAGALAIAQKSFNGCGLQEILRDAGVPKGSFYHYFASKEEFGIALVEKARDEHMERVSEYLADRKRSPRQRLKAMFEAFRAELAESGAARECLIPKLALETCNLSAPVRAAVKCAYDQWEARLAQVLREAQAAGEIEPGQDPERLASMVAMLFEGATIRMGIDQSVEPVDAFLEFVFGTLLAPRAA